MKKASIILLATIEALLFLSCKDQGTTQNEQTPEITVKTLRIIQGDIENIISLNGKTIYLKKNAIISPIAGFILKMNIKYGDKVQKNDVLFEIQTKENKALQNDSAIMANRGIIKILASSDGIVYELNINEPGAYVVEGSLLCSIMDNENLMVQVNVPFHNNSVMNIGTTCKILLSDHTTLSGTVYEIMPTINEANQTQNVLIKPETTRKLPENLNLTVQFVNVRHRGSYLVPKEAVLTNETLSEFWVMRVTDNNLAIKIPVIKGIENDSLVEIISSRLEEKDLVISEGAYGLPDSTVIKIIK
jgi:hypothetical protein